MYNNESPFSGSNPFLSAYKNVMFKKNELRPGNYVQGQPFSHSRLGMWNDGITQPTYYGLHVYDTTIVEKYQPILLNDEWFKKLGFEFNPFNKWWIKGEFIISKIDIDGLFYYFGNYQITSVHQLQNIYFDLVGEELLYL